MNRLWRTCSSEILSEFASNLIRMTMLANASQAVVSCLGIWMVISTKAMQLTPSCNMVEEKALACREPVLTVGSTRAYSIRRSTPCLEA